MPFWAIETVVCSKCFLLSISLVTSTIMADSCLSTDVLGLSPDISTKSQKAMVRESLTRAFDELHSGKVHHDARKLFTK